MCVPPLSQINGHVPAPFGELPMAVCSTRPCYLHSKKNSTSLVRAVVLPMLGLVIPSRACVAFLGVTQEDRVQRLRGPCSQGIVRHNHLFALSHAVILDPLHFVRQLWLASQPWTWIHWRRHIGLDRRLSHLSSRLAESLTSVKVTTPGPCGISGLGHVSRRSERSIEGRVTGSRICAIGQPE